MSAAIDLCKHVGPTDADLRAIEAAELYPSDAELYADWSGLGDDELTDVVYADDPPFVVVDACVVAAYVGRDADETAAIFLAAFMCAPSDATALDALAAWGLIAGASAVAQLRRAPAALAELPLV